MISRIHVNQHFVRANTKDGGSRPVYTVKRGGKTHYAREVVVHGDVRFVYDTVGLACGARCYGETTADVELIGEMSFKEAQSIH